MIFCHLQNLRLEAKYGGVVLDHTGLRDILWSCWPGFHGRKDMAMYKRPLLAAPQLQAELVATP